MYMVKRVFKNKRLMRSLLILAGFFIVGFFLWTMLFKRSSVFEGQTTGQGPVDVYGASNACPSNTVEEYSRCLMGKLNMTETVFDAATNDARTKPDSNLNDILADVQRYFSNSK